MGLLDSILGGALGAGQQQQAPGGLGAAGPLLQIVMQMLSKNGQFGGLEGLLQQFQQAGLGQQVSSWISSGENLPISPVQLEQVFGRGSMREMASQAGMDEGAFGGALAHALPQLIDRVTPEGRVPDQGLDDVLSSLSNLMPRS